MVYEELLKIMKESSPLSWWTAWFSFTEVSWVFIWFSEITNMCISKTLDFLADKKSFQIHFVPTKNENYKN
jgi:hypothetical protein